MKLTNPFKRHKGVMERNLEQERSEMIRNRYTLKDAENCRDWIRVLEQVPCLDDLILPFRQDLATVEAHLKQYPPHESFHALMEQSHLLSKITRIPPMAGKDTCTTRQAIMQKQDWLCKKMGEAIP